jgi:hypothetical protein
MTFLSYFTLTSVLITASNLGYERECIIVTKYSQQKFVRKALNYTQTADKSRGHLHYPPHKTFLPSSQRTQCPVHISTGQ